MHYGRLFYKPHGCWLSLYPLSNYNIQKNPGTYCGPVPGTVRGNNPELFHRSFCIWSFIWPTLFPIHLFFKVLHWYVFPLQREIKYWAWNAIFPCRSKDRSHTTMEQTIWQSRSYRPNLSLRFIDYHSSPLVRIMGCHRYGCDEGELKGCAPVARHWKSCARSPGL